MNNSNNKIKSGKSGSLKIIPLGGLEEIGKNLTALEYGNDIMIIDCGMSFPDDDMYGIDVVIPDFTYLIENAKKIRGIVITHGHEDHIGAIPYLEKKLNVPIWATKLPLGLIKNKLDEHGLKCRLHAVEAGDKIKLGVFKVETIRTTHSIADSICLCIDTPVGKIFHSGDFKVDFTPVDGEPIDLGKLAEIGREGVLLMMCDSTNAVRSGFTRSEKFVGDALEDIFRAAKDRIIVATFSSNVHRIQKMIDIAVMCHRKVAISGRSMINVVTLAIELGYLKIPKGVLIDVNKTKNISDKELVIITTGSQGEPMSALARMASNEHKAIKIKKGDTVILSSNPIPGNEKLVSNIVNELFELGADVIYSDIAETHVSGHACQEELKLIHSLIKPRFFMPVHGEYRHLKAHADLAQELGMKEKDIFIMQNGDCLQLTHNRARVIPNVTQADGVMVDGLGVGDVGNIVMRDRRLLSESGLIIVVCSIQKGTGEIVSGPDLISRGFVYVRENEDLMGEAKKVVEKSLERCSKNNNRDWNSMKGAVRDDLRKFIYNRTERNPIILPIFMEV
ncbi:MAG: ribonuclease J [Eubacteriaceae bacterium]|jgi:ribonuclease J|nr:ribonuclease J [Eubacteriaceae bacterium]